MRLFSVLRACISRESGVTLIETVVALAVLGLIAVTFLSGLVASSKAAFAADEQATAQNLAQSQMEWVKNASYNTTGYYSPGPIPSGKDYVGYSANITVEALPDHGIDIQKIIVTVAHSGEQVITLEGYKVFR